MLARNFGCSPRDQSTAHAYRKSKNRVALPSDERLLKVVYLALRNNGKKWMIPIRG